MSKPVLMSGGRCGKCHAYDTVALMSDSAYILWCSCGQVETCEKGAVHFPYKFGEEAYQSEGDPKCKARKEGCPAAAFFFTPPPFVLVSIVY